MSGKIKWLWAICVLGAPLSVHAAVSNGDFETGNLTSWTTIGATHADNGVSGVAPPQGAFQAYIDNTGNFAAVNTAVFASLGTPPSEYAAIGEGAPTTGSAISQDITVAAGDVLSFDWNFLTDEHNEDIQYNDFCVFTVGSDAFLLCSRNSTFFTLDLSSPPAGFDGQTHYSTQTFTFPSAGTFKIGFAVFNVGDAGHNSVLLLDNVAISVPEPSGMAALMLSALAMKRRRKKHL